MKNKHTRAFWFDVEYYNSLDSTYLREILHDTEAPINGRRTRRLNAIRHVLTRRLLQNEST